MQRPTAYLCSEDPQLGQRVRGYLSAWFTWEESGADTNELLRRLECGPERVLFIDLRTRQGRQLLADLDGATIAQTVIIGIDDPVQGPHPLPPGPCLASLPVSAGRTAYQQAAHQASLMLNLLQQNRLLKESKAQPAMPCETPQKNKPREPGLGPFLRAARHFDQPQALLNHVVEALASATLVYRAGIFSRLDTKEPFCCMSVLHPLPESRKLFYEADSPLVNWMRTRAHLVARRQLDLLEPSERILLRDALDLFGADLLVPMHGRSGLLGWAFLGPRSTGRPYDDHDLEEIVLLVDHMAITIENARLYEEAADQHSRDQALLQAMPNGLIAVEPNGIIRWFNHTAETLLLRQAADMIGHPVDRLGSVPADLLYRAMETSKQKPPEPVEWRLPEDGRLLRAEAHPVSRQDRLLGSLLILYDRTEEVLLREKKEHLERRSFWIDLAAAMSHEVRNPLVAIKTFAQLLPSRYDDPDFRQEFADLFTSEIDRLDAIVNKINRFAHPAALQKQAVSMAGLLDKALQAAKSGNARAEAVTVQQDIPDDLPSLYGDSDLLTDAFVQLFTNAFEALLQSDSPVLTVRAMAIRSRCQPRVVITVQDNGPGVPDDIRDKIFSPFSTSKPAGLGLGLAMVRRTVLDHNGFIHIDSSPAGTRVTVEFAVQQAQEAPEARDDFALCR